MSQKNSQYSPKFEVNIDNSFDWLRVKTEFKIGAKEWEAWKMTQFIVRFYAGHNVVKSNMIRVQRLLNDNEQKQIYIDSKIPKVDFDKVEISYWNGTSDKEIYIRGLVVEIFDEN